MCLWQRQQRPPEDITMLSSCILTLLSLTMVREVSGVTDPNCSYAHLLEHLELLNSNQVLENVRPVVNWTSVTEVKIDLYVYGILDVDEKTQTLTCQVWSNMGWVNEFLSWKESDFCGIDKLAVPRTKLWMPDVSIQEDISSRASVTKGPYAMVYPNGLVSVKDSLRLTTACTMNLDKFPFDTQTCKMTITSISHSNAAIVINQWSTSENLSQFSHQALGNQGEWILVNISVTKEENIHSALSWDKLIFKITIRRSPMLYIVNFLIPLLCFLILDLASFFISQARGEKLSFKITILLSISVMLLIFNDILPSTADRLPLIASYCAVVFIVVGFNLLVSILVGFLLDLDQNQKEGCDLQTRASVQSRAPQNEAERDVPSEASPEQKAPGGGTQGLSDPKVLQLALEEVWRIRQEVTSAAAGDHRKPGYWERVARRVDLAYFCIYIVGMIVYHSFLFILWS